MKKIADISDYDRYLDGENDRDIASRGTYHDCPSGNRVSVHCRTYHVYIWIG